MKKSIFPLSLLLTLSGCAHQQSAYGGGGGGYFADDCLYSYGCYDGIYGRNTQYSVFPVSPQAPARTRVTRVERRTSTRVVTRSAGGPTGSIRSAPARSFAGAGSLARSAPAAAPSRAGGRR